MHNFKVRSSTQVNIKIKGYIGVLARLYRHAIDMHGIAIVKGVVGFRVGLGCRVQGAGRMSLSFCLWAGCPDTSLLQKVKHMRHRTGG